MLRNIILFFTLGVALFASKVETDRWENAQTYLVFLEKHNLPAQELYYNLDKDDQTLTEDILTGVHYQILRDSNNSIEQILIPVNDELQIHIYKEKNSYAFEAIPIISETKTEAFTLKIQNSPYYDIIKETGSKKLATIFISSFKNSLNFKRDLRKDDTLAMIYEQKYRLGKPFSMPELKVSMIEMRGKQHFIYLNKDDRYYNESGNEVEGFLLAKPVRNARITSKFTKRRWHPILHKYRAHLGIDFGARRGTPILAAGSGRIIFAGYTRGYGNLIKIAHGDGYVTLYAHQKSFRKGMRKGKYVKKGQVIGYVGTTGLSTGPHLHFGLYKNGRAINPLRVVQVTTRKLTGKKREDFMKLKEDYNENIALHLKNHTKFHKDTLQDQCCYIFNPKKA